MGNTREAERPTTAGHRGGAVRVAPAGTAAGAQAAGGRYVLGELLGRGGMAEVFAGRALGSLGFQKPVAIKRLLPERARDNEFVSRLVAEAKLLVGLQHTNVISVLDLVRDGDDVFLVMEFVDGPSLRQLITVRRQRGLGPLPLGLAAYVVQAACAGLEYAHARPTGAIVHADVSPSNVLLTQAGEVKVADFGIARREGTAAAVEGKWAYMPPEQARGEALTARSDEFALGVVLYELITGVHPFARRVSEHGRDEGAVENVRQPRSFRPEIPLHLEAACLKAMAPSPGDRYSRLQYLHDALAEIRFACGWRDGAPELAAAIAEAMGGGGTLRSAELGGVVGAGSGGGGGGGLGAMGGMAGMSGMAGIGPGRTQVTAHPVTLVTKSLLEGSHSQSKSGPGSVLGAGSVSRSASASARSGGLISGSDLAMPVAPAEMTTPHAWSTSTEPGPQRRALRWQPIALVLAGAGALGAVIAAMIVSSSPVAPIEPAQQASLTAAAPSPIAAPDVQPIAARHPAPTVTTTETETETATETETETGTETETETETGTETDAAGRTDGVAKVRAATAPSRTSTRASAASRAADRRAADDKRAAAARDADDEREARDRNERDVRDQRRDRDAASGNTGAVRIYSKPWAYIQLDGKRYETPTTLTLPAGIHDITLYNPEEGIRKTVTVTVRPGKPKTLTVRLAP